MKRFAAPIAAVAASLIAGPLGAQAELPDRDESRINCEIGGLTPAEARRARPSRLQIAWNPVEDADLENEGGAIAVRVSGAGGVLRGERAYALTEVELLANADSDDYPAEARFIHENAMGDRVVVGVYLTEGAANPGFETLREAIDAKDGKVLKGLHPAELLPESDARLVMANRTPAACAPRVIWTVVDAPVEASREQLDALVPLMTLASREQDAAD